MSNTTWAPDPNKHAYTWTFNKRGLLIRYFLWMYQADQTSMTFCRFFWGMVCTPIALPIRLVKVLVSVAGRSLVIAAKSVVAISSWASLLDPILLVRGKVSQLRDNYSASRRIATANRLAEDEARLMARIMAERKRYEEEFKAWEMCYYNYGGVEQGPRPLVPSAPSIQSRVADSVGAFVDKLVAWSQDHPKLVARTSQFITRCIFYPAAFIIPTGIVGVAGFETWDHRGGLDVLHPAWSDPISGIGLAFREVGGALWFALKVAGPILLLALAVGAAFGVFFTVCIFAMILFDKRDEKKMMMKKEAIAHGEGKSWQPGYNIDAREAPNSLFFLQARAALSKRREHYGNAIGALGGKLSPVAKGAGLGALVVGKMLFKGAAKVTDGITVAAGAGKTTAVKSAVAVRTTGSFLGAAHHAIKYRTCPRIEITE